jgi:hypothetical protein
MPRRRVGKGPPRPASIGGVQGDDAVILRVRETVRTFGPLPPDTGNQQIGRQFFAVAVVLIAVFALPCCPRIDGWFSSAVAAQAAVADAAVDHAHHPAHHHHQHEAETEGMHKGHLMSTGAIDVLPALMPVILAGPMPLTLVGACSIAALVQERIPQVPVPPPRWAT